MRNRRKVLFLQLPNLDNDVRGPRENIPLAAAYLRHALARSPEGRHHVCMLPEAADDTLDDRHLACRVAGRRPAVIAATLYVWNVERTLGLLRRIRALLPGTRIAVGGPEVARGHPFLFHGAPFDAAVAGEGEGMFPALLRAFRLGGRPDFSNVAWCRRGRPAWGRRAFLESDLGDVLPPARRAPLGGGDGTMAWEETSRGCPWRCTFCAYGHSRRTRSVRSAAQVLARIRSLRRRGVREIRFIDPTLNANPQFPAIVAGLARINRDRRIRFFAELRPEALSPATCRLLRNAGFDEVEIGLQSRNPRVLSAVSRGTNLPAAEAGIRNLARAGVHTTIDVMCGLPLQTSADVRRSVGWASNVPHARVQFLHTLLLPGTALRASAAKWGLRAPDLPPYRVNATATLTARDMLAAEQFARRRAGGGLDTPTARFVGTSLPDLFPEVVRVEARDEVSLGDPAGSQNRRAVVLTGDDLFPRRRQLARLLRSLVFAEPHILWQFVLSIRQEEPLDLLESLIGVVRSCPSHFVDRMITPGETRLIASRRVMVLLRRSHICRNGWIVAAERLLASSFY